jgi:hypothetical protein
MNFELNNNNNLNVLSILDISNANNENLFIDSDIESDSENDNENDTGIDTGIDTEDESEDDNDIDNLDNLQSKNKFNSYLFYNQSQEMQYEIDNYNYHLKKNTGDWLLAKNIIASSENKTNTEFFWDHLDLLFKDKQDNFDNIIKIIYSSDNTLIEFDTKISKYIVDNLKICKYKPNGYLFNNNNDTNIWSFKIVVITSKNIYAANRYIDEHKLGCF